MMKKKIAIAGSGFAGAVIARNLAETGKYLVEVYDEREHIGGNCFTRRDSKTRIQIHQYGPHIFNTSREDVWEYMNRWTKFGPYVNRVKAITDRGVFSLPMNLLTINQFFGRVFSPAEARNFLQGLGDTSITDPKTFEEQALKFLGRDLYETFFYGYTKKQWGLEPRELPASILKRLPVRFNYDDNYFNQKYQGIPLEGYTPIFEKILEHPAIRLHLGQRLTADARTDFDHLFWSGPLDSYFQYKLGRLSYRSLRFERFDESGDFQGNAVINDCRSSVSHTRISEHKHFTPWEEHADTVCFREFSQVCGENDIPYYPVRLENDKALLAKYVHLAREEKGVSFIGRLGTYRYLDMHVVIGESLDLSRHCSHEDNSSRWPHFSQNPLS
jgi:UDP-galactopyranose mutase